MEVHHEWKKVSVKSMVIQNKTQISLTLNETGKSSMTGSNVQNAKDGKVFGDSRNVTMDCAVQQDMGSGTVYTEAEARQLNMQPTELPDTGAMSPSEFISRSMTGKDADVLSDEETPLEEYTSSQLERAVSRVKEQRAEARQAVERQVEQERKKEEAIEQNMIHNALGSDLSAQLEHRLEESDLPVTPETVTRLANAVELTEQRLQFSQASMKFFIGNEWEITPEHIGASVFGNPLMAGRSQTTVGSSFDEVQEQVKNILQGDGLDVTEGTMQTAQWLYDNQLPVTSENVQTYRQLEEIKDMDSDVLIERIVDHLADGISPEKADLTKLSRREAGEKADRLLGADEAQLRQVYPSEIEFLSAKRQLEEIRLSMTAEAARSMAARGIDLDLSNLENIVSDLRIQEQQAKENWLVETGLPVTEENAELLSGTVAAAKNVLAAPVDFLARTMVTADRQTLGELSDTAVSMKEQYDRMERTYEAVGTEVRRDLGDSIRKAFGNVDEILNDLGLEITAVNQRAVRILGYNQMELTTQNIENMKAYDEKMTSLMEDLKPPVAAELIRQGINPLELSLDELNKEVRSVREHMSVDDISFRKFMWKMDHHGDMSEQERKSMIGIYRLLDKIEKSDGAVIGQVVKEGREVSLASLLSATRTRRAEGMDVQVNDGFGGLERTVSNGTSIDSQIMAAYQTSLAGKLKEEFSPAVLKELGEDGWNQSLESLLEEMRSGDILPEDMTEYYEQMAKDIASAMEDAEGNILAFLESLDLPDSARNRMMAQSYLNNNLKESFRLWKEDDSEELMEVFDEPEELESVYEKIDANHEKEMAKLRENDDITYDDVITLAKMAGGISFYKSLREYQSYEVPIVTGQGVTSCHVTIRSGEQKKGSVEISVESDSLGMVQATFRVTERRVRGFVTTERTDSMDICRQILAGFEKDLEENGFTMESDNLVQGSRRSLQEINEQANGAKNRDLYQVAKCFITNVAGKDEKI